MTRQKLLLIGGSRGLGADLRSSLEKDCDLTATTRNRNKADGTDLGYLDLSDPLTFQPFLETIGDIQFDLVLFVAAFTIPENASSDYVKNFRFGSLDYNYFAEMLKVNCYAQVKLFEMLMANGLLAEDAKVCFFSSRAGAIATRGKLPKIFTKKSSMTCSSKSISTTNLMN